MKKCILLLFPLCLLLSGCGASKREAVQAYYKSIQTARMQAQVVVHLSSDDRSFTVAGTYDRAKGATTTIVEPEALQGLSASVTAEEMQLLYDGSVWPAGDGSGLSAANCLPLLLYATGEGFVTREGTDRMDGQAYIFLATDASVKGGEKFSCTLWVQPETFAPYAAELSRDGQVLLTVTFTQFTCQTGENTNENA